MDKTTTKTQAQTTAARSGTGHLGTIRRVIWYVLRIVLIVSILLGLCYGVFTEAMYISNIYVVVTEGMALRADTILKEGSISDLSQYFTEDFINSDYLLYMGVYRGYTVESYDYSYEIKGVRVLPWGRTAAMKYIERIPTINGTPDAEVEGGSEIPPWSAQLCSIELTKTEGRWLISGITVLEENPQEDVLPTPDYSRLEGSAAPTGN